MLVSVGSHSNVDDSDTIRRNTTAPTCCSLCPKASSRKCMPGASGIAWARRSTPSRGALVLYQRRDALGDNLVPDYITHVEEGGFTAGPGYYMGGHQDPAACGETSRAEEQGAGAGCASATPFRLAGDALYDGWQFPAEYKGDVFAAEHGSWNRQKRAGYEVIRAPLENGKATGEYEDFLTGFVTADGRVLGAPGGSGSGAGRFVVRQRRWIEVDLARNLHGQK